MRRDPLGVVGVVGIGGYDPCCAVQLKELGVGFKDICPYFFAAE